MARAQFRDTVQLRWPNGAVGMPPSTATATAALYNVGTSTPIADTVYADNTSGTTLPNPLMVGADGLVNFWLASERELDLYVTCAGYTPVRTTVTTDGATSGLPAGGTSGQVLTKTSSTDYATSWQTPSSGGLALPLTQNLTFSPDTTYDIGDSGGTTRPRNVYVGGIADFGTSVGNKISLYTGSYGMGILSNAWTAYMPDTAAFYWAKGGAVNGTQVAAMSGGGYLTFLTTGVGDKIRIYDPGAGAAYGMGLATSQLVSFIPTGANFFTWAAGGAYSGTAILKLDTNAAWIPTNNVIEQRNATNPQTLRIYQTFTDASNYARLTITCGATTTIYQEQAGTGPVSHLFIGTQGAGAALQFNSAGTGRWQIPGTGHLIAVADNAYDIGASGANRPRNGFFAGAVATGVKAGAAIDGDVINPTDGMIRIDSTNGRMYARYGGAWHYAALT